MSSTYILFADTIIIYKCVYGEQLVLKYKEDNTSGCRATVVHVYMQSVHVCTHSTIPSSLLPE